MVRQEVSVRKTVSESKIAQLKDAAGSISVIIKYSLSRVHQQMPLFLNDETK